MTETETAWAAGLLEGEGSFSCHWVRQGGRLYHGHVLSLNLTDRDVVERLASVTGVGRVRALRRASRYKPAWIWRVYRRADVADLLTAVKPHFGVRRRARAEKILGCIRAETSARP